MPSCSGGTSAQQKTWLRARSPLSRVDQIRRPLLIGHGANDVRCKQQESDQIVAASPGAIGRRAITKSLELRYLRPLPLDEEVALWGVCVPTGDDTFRARCTITARDKLAVEGRAELVSFESFHERGSAKE